MTDSATQKRASPMPPDPAPFGRHVLAGGYATREQLQQARSLARQRDTDLMQALASVTECEPPAELVRQYQAYRLFELKVLYGVEFLDPDVAGANAHSIEEALELGIPLQLCRQYRLLPLQLQSGDPPTLVVGMVKPDDLSARDELNRRLRGQNVRLQRRVITAQAYQQLLDRYLALRRERQQEQDTQKNFDISQDLQNIANELEDADERVDFNLDEAIGEAQDAPIINLVNRMLVKALKEEASDIHLEPQEEYLRVRFRKDGVLHQAFEPLPIRIAPAIAARFKIMANLDIAEKRLPQDGKIRRKYNGRNIDFRVSSLPSRYGEKIVLRILDNSSTQLGLDQLITDPGTLGQVRGMVKRPFGLILVTGPTGSGKSTTLYSGLAERNDPGVNIGTVEDPIEYSLPGITQVQVLREKGMDFASVLRAFLRQDPDVLLVGETRDRETAKTAIEAALTGHLVLTTLHTNDAAGAIARLDEMGVEPFMISGSLLGVLAQRLMRRVCPQCAQRYTPTAEELARFGLSSAHEESNVTFYRANVLPPDAIETAKRQGTLCSHCKGAGYTNLSSGCTLAKQHDSHIEGVPEIGI